MERIVNTFLSKLQDERIIDMENMEIFQFGLECMLLKTLHFASYLMIGILTGEILSLLVSLSVMIPLRKKAGGYHAKTRTGCYIFSCSMVLLLCIFNKIAPMLPIVCFIGVIISDMLILHFAPVENENRKLDGCERNRFRRQALGYLICMNIIILFLSMTDTIMHFEYWINNGLIFTGVLLVCSMKEKYQIQSDASNK